MKYSTITSWPAMAGGVIAAAGATSLLVRDGFSSGFTLEHALMPVMVGLTILSGHLLWQALVEWRAMSAAGFLVLAIVGSSLTVYETMGRRAEIRDSKVAAAVAANTVVEEKRAELARATARLEEAENMVKREMTGERCGKRCQDWKVRVSEVEAKIEKLTREIAATGGEKPVDAKADRAAAVIAILMPTVKEEAIKGAVSVFEPFVLPLFLELGSIILFGFGLGRREFTNVEKSVATVSVSDSAQTSFDMTSLPAPDVFSDPTPPARKRKPRKKTEKREKVLAFVRDYTLKHGHPPAFQVVRGRFHLPKVTAHRYRQEAIQSAA